jgi:hypothetical protein
LRIEEFFANHAWFGTEFSAYITMSETAEKKCLSLRKSKDSPAEMGQFAPDQIVEPGACRESETSDLLPTVRFENPQAGL